MSRRVVAAIAGGSVAIGILVGAAGSVFFSVATAPSLGSMPTQMAAMHASMVGQMGTGMASYMTEMMGGGMMGGGMMGSGMWDWGNMTGPMDPGAGAEVHRLHHPPAQ